LSKIILLIFTCFFLLTNLISAQENEEKLYDEFRNIFNKKYLNVGALIQVVGDHQIERTFANHNGFTIQNLRFKLFGEFDEGIGYAIQTNFLRAPAILDARIYYKLTPNFFIDAGLYKTPFSREQLTSSSNIDFVSRSQVVLALGPNRQVGVSVRGAIADKLFQYQLGAFNGNRFSTSGNDNNDLFYVGRVSITPKISNQKSDNFEIGINAGQGNEKSIPIAGETFEGKRLLLGADARLTLEKIMLSGEYINAKLNSSGGEEFSPSGFYATAGYMICTNNQILLRIDSIKMDKDMDSNNLIILGYNIWPTKIAKFQINYIIPEYSRPKQHRLMVNAQVNI
jgi:hypothetical protein